MVWNENFPIGFVSSCFSLISTAKKCNRSVHSKKKIIFLQILAILIEYTRSKQAESPLHISLVTVTTYIYLAHAQSSKLKKPFIRILNTFTWALNNLSDFAKYLKSIPLSNISFIFHYITHQCFEYFFSSKL